MWWTIAAAVSHFAMIGFPVATNSPAEMSIDVERYIADCDPIELKPQKIACLISDPSGAELWVGLDEKGGGARELQTLNPAFRGRGSTKIVVTAVASATEWQPFENTVQADFAKARTPLIFDLADPREATRFLPDAALEIDLTGFADEIEIYASDEAYYRSQSDKKAKFAANHFIPSGMFTTGGEGPTAHALFAGKIIESELRRNERGKSNYWWILVRTYDDALINVVADPSQLRARPVAGDVLSGSFWLTARLVKG